jgi:hypothetical protein
MQQTYRQSGCVYYSDCADFADPDGNDGNALFISLTGVSTDTDNSTGTFD